MRDMHFKSIEAKPSRTFTICIFLRDIGHIYTTDGTEFTVNLPLSVQRIWPMQPVGLIIQSLPPISDSALFGLPSSLPPTTFSLVSPYDELRPVIVLPLTPPSSSQKANETLQPDERIIYISPTFVSTNRPNPNLLATVSPSRGALVIYRYSEQGFDEEGADGVAEESKPNPTAAGVSSSGPVQTSASTRTSGRLAGKRRVSQSRNELSVTMDRMVIDSSGMETITEGSGRSAVGGAILEQLYSVSLDSRE